MKNSTTKTQTLLSQINFTFQQCFDSIKGNLYPIKKPQLTTGQTIWSTDRKKLWPTREMFQIKSYNKQ